MTKASDDFRVSKDLVISIQLVLLVLSWIFFAASGVVSCTENGVLTDCRARLEVCRDRRAGE